MTDFVVILADETLTESEVFEKATARAVAETVTESEVFTKAYAGVLSETVTLDDGSHVTAHTRVCTETVTQTDTAPRAIARALSTETVTETGTALKAAAKVLTQTVTQTGTAYKGGGKTLSESVTQTEYFDTGHVLTVATVRSDYANLAATVQTYLDNNINRASPSDLKFCTPVQVASDNYIVLIVHTTS